MKSKYPQSANQLLTAKERPAWSHIGELRNDSRKLPERLLTPQEVAEIFSVSTAWVLDHSSRRHPQLPCVKLGKAVRYRPADVEAFIVKCSRMKGGAA
jgi:predicted DNA-binding transcriptional regulator AlpA